MSSSNIYDKRTLFIKCDCASVEQIRQAFNDALTNYQTQTKINLKCRFRVNLVENREGKSLGIAFVFVTNPAVYHMLLGKNPDGSDRIEYRDDPSWTPLADGTSVNDAGWSTISAPVYTPANFKTLDWADIMEEEEEYERKLQAEKDKYVCPKIPFPLEPLMTLPPYKLTPEQIADKREKLIEDNEGKQGFDPDLVDVPEYAHLVVDRAMATHVDPKYMPNILKCKTIPDWVTKEDLKIQFSPYASDSETRQERFIKGRRVEETYPFVNINEDRVGFVIFDASTNDALFALHMMKKTTIRKTMPDGTVNNVTLIFGHSFRTDRDLMADISQRPRPVQRRDNNNNSTPSSRSNRHDQPQNNTDREGFRNNNSRDGQRNQRNNAPRDPNRNNNAIRAVAATAVPQRRQQAESNISNKFALLNVNS